MMFDSYDLGKKGEVLATDYLVKNGYQILERNWRSGHKEIDIIALKDEVLAIVEVKTRTTEDYGDPDIAVGLYKQKMLICAADAYVRYRNLDVDVRFDIISIILDGTEPKIEHIEDAFYATPQNSRW